MMHYIGEGKFPSSSQAIWTLHFCVGELLVAIFGCPFPSLYGFEIPHILELCTFDPHQNLGREETGTFCLIENRLEISSSCPPAVFSRCAFPSYVVASGLCETSDPNRSEWRC